VRASFSQLSEGFVNEQGSRHRGRTLSNSSLKGSMHTLIARAVSFSVAGAVIKG
jgi:hypothetical protein